MVKKTKKTMQESFNELDELIEKFWGDVFKTLKIDKLDKWLSRFKWLNK